MASIAAVYTARRLVSASALKLYACVAALWGLAQLVWVERVFQNLAHVGWGSAAQFMLAAVLNTDMWVQAVLAVLVVAGVSLLLDLLRTPAYGRFA